MGPRRPAGFAAHASSRIVTATSSQPHCHSGVHYHCVTDSNTHYCHGHNVMVSGRIITVVSSQHQAALSQLYCHSRMTMAACRVVTGNIEQHCRGRLVTATMLRRQARITALGGIVMTPRPHRHGIRLQCHGSTVTVTSSQAHCHGCIVTVAGLIITLRPATGNIVTSAS